MITCREVTEQADDYLDDDLGIWAATKVRMHLLACRHCRTFVMQMRTVIRLINEHGYTLPPDEADQNLMDAFRKQTRDASK